MGTVLLTERESGYQVLRGSTDSQKSLYSRHRQRVPPFQPNTT